MIYYFLDHRADAIEWATDMASRPLGEVLILDVETTDIDGEIIELAIIDMAGKILYNGRFNPQLKISYNAYTVHRISQHELKDQPVWLNEYPRIRQILTDAEVVLIYHAPFDVGRITKTNELHKCEQFDFNSVCVLKWYKKYTGKSYSLRLDGDHSAKGDCLRVLELIREMCK